MTARPLLRGGDLIVDECTPNAEVKDFLRYKP